MVYRSMSLGDVSLGAITVTTLTYVSRFDIQRAYRALFRRHERAFVCLAARERRVRDSPEMFLVPVEAPDLVLVNRVRGRDEKPEDEQRQRGRDRAATCIARHNRSARGTMGLVTDRAPSGTEKPARKS